jgi:Xaa-Pro dipeptidase
MEKILKLKELLRSRGIDSIIIGPSDDLEYLIGFKSSPDDRFQGYFINSDPNKEDFYVVPKINHEEVAKHVGQVEYIIWGDEEGFLDKTIEKLKSQYDYKPIIAVNFTIRANDTIDMLEQMDIKFINGHRLMEDFRISKTKEEIENMKIAGQIADKTMDDIFNFIKAGMYESEIKDEIVRLLIENGGDDISFEPIVASGPNSSMPHYNEGTRKIKEKDVIILDFGCKYKGMCSDTSRTIFVGDVSSEEMEIYNIVKEAFEKGQAVSAEDVTADFIDTETRNIIDDKGYGQYFLNRTGHGIGFSVHEAPYIKKNNERIIADGMAFSIEPGIYIPGKFGMRIENIVAFKNGEKIIMNNSSTEIRIVKV